MSILLNAIYIKCFTGRSMEQKKTRTRNHPSRMHTARLLTVGGPGGVYLVGVSMGVRVQEGGV